MERQPSDSVIVKLPTTGTVLADKYELDDVLGEGGFGVVYRATTISTGRPVAVKILKPSGQISSSHTARFLREMKTVARLQCPHTMTLYDFGRTPDGVLFMVCEFIDGEDLLELLARRGQLREYEVVHIVRQVLVSLAEAHELGVLHRDIKPANIRLTEYEGDPLYVKVLDFGLAKSWKLDDEAALTQSGKIIGTPRYMSPEQMAGFQLTPASDIYSLGLLAVELLLGRESIAHGHRHQLNLSADGRMSPPVAHILQKMIAADLKQRYSRASEVLADFGAVQRPTEHLAPTPPADAPNITPGPTSRRPSSVIVVVGLALLSLVAVIVVALRMDREEPATRADLDLPPALNETAPSVPSVPSPTRVEDAGSVEVEPDLAVVGSGPCAGYPALSPGVHTIESVRGLSTERVVVGIPKGYAPEVSTGLVLAFTDIGRQPEMMMDVAQIDSLSASDLPYVMVVFAPTHGMMRRWTPQAAKAALAKLPVVLENVCIDLERVFALGRGNGTVAVIEAVNSANVLAAGVSDFRGTMAGELDALTVPVLNIPERYEEGAPPGVYPFLQRYLDFFKSNDPGLGGPQGDEQDADSGAD